MNNFDFCTPTRIIFGKGSIARLPELLPARKKIMVVYGGGSIKTNGVYEQVKRAMDGFDWIEFGDVEPNPRYETLMRAVKIAQEKQVGFLLSVGGGSVLDGTKFIAAAACFTQGDPWTICAAGATVERALPLGDVITLPATGSEMNGNAVISRESSAEKFAFGSPLVMPQFSIIDPETTYTLPERQTRNGIVDTFVHVMEQYATREVNTPVQDLSAIAIIRTLVQEAPKVLRQPKDYEARANLFWCATLGLNYWIAQGTVQDWSTHMIGHELTAIFGLDHAQTLAIVLPRLWKHRIEFKAAKLAKLGREVWNVAETDERGAALACIERTLDFFRAIGMKTSLAEYGLDASQAAGEIYRRFTARGTTLGEDPQMDATQIAAILKEC